MQSRLHSLVRYKGFEAAIRDISGICVDKHSGTVSPLGCLEGIFALLLLLLPAEDVLQKRNAARLDTIFGSVLLEQAVKMQRMNQIEVTIDIGWPKIWFVSGRYSVSLVCRLY